MYLWIDSIETNFLLSTEFYPSSITMDPYGWVLGDYFGSEVGVLGDANLDNYVNILDIIGIANYILSSIELMEIEFFLMDVDGDYSISIMDIIQVVNIILDNAA